MIPDEKNGMSIPDRPHAELVAEIMTLRKHLAETEEDNRRLQRLCQEIKVIGAVDDEKYGLIAEDITGQKHLELQLLHSQKMEEVEAMAGVIAHDFNNILSSMIGYTELAMDEPDEKERLADLQQVLRSCNRAKSLVIRIIAFSKRTSIDKRPVDLSSLAMETNPEQKIAGGTGEHILFVDDEEMLVKLGRGMLMRLGYTVADATDSSLALRMFMDNPEGYDLVVTDMTMPGMNGLELAREIRKIRPEIPTILCTGYSELVNEEKAKQEGFNRFIQKPLHIRDLAAAVRDVLAGRKARK
jgi:CheY-like chemotaxis protein